MTDNSLVQALEREHREIDAAIETFAAGFTRGQQMLKPLAHALQALRRHIYLEEEFLFPSARMAGMEIPVYVMHCEHARMWRLLDQLEPKLAAGDRGPAVRDSYRELMILLAAHNHREERTIYRCLDALLNAEAAGRLMQHFTSGRMPADWTIDGMQAEESGAISSDLAAGVATAPMGDGRAHNGE